MLDSRRVSLVLRHTNGPGLKPWEIIKSVFHLREEDLLKVLKTDEVVE
jgi:hypothetical protein